MTPYDAPTGSVWEYDFGGRFGANQFIVLDGHDERFASRGRRVVWLRDGRAVHGDIMLNSRVNNRSVRIA